MRTTAFHIAPAPAAAPAPPDVGGMDDGALVAAVRDGDERPYREIAALTGVKLGTVRSRLNRARQSFAAIDRPWMD